MAKCTDTYKEIREFDFPNMKVRVHIPELTEEERNRRIEIIKQAASDLLKSEMLRSKEAEIKETNET